MKMTNSKLVYLFLALFLSAITIGSSELTLAANGPTIDVWYGLEQSFGQIGTPQEWVNIFGNLSDPDGIDTGQLTYSLNGGSAQAYKIGPDKRRLAQAGDFNIDLNIADLNEGENTLLITAVDQLANDSTETVTLNFTQNKSWPTNYTSHWSSAPTINHVAQIVDGLWQFDNGGVRPTVMDYDRLIAIGATDWKDYTAVVPVTVHALDTATDAYGPISQGPGIGLLVHWQGHYQVFGSQPHWGWDNIGALAWYHWDSPSVGGYEMYEHGGTQIFSQQATFQLNQPYWLKIEVETRPGQTALYRYKVWLQSESEPAAWTIEGEGVNGEPGQGSLLLVAHHVDVTFGDVIVNNGSDPISFTDFSLYLPAILRSP